MSRHLQPVAVHLVLERADRLFLLRRANTGWGDGLLSVIAGHVEAGESMTDAMVREAAEEAGIAVDPADLAFAHMSHRRVDGITRVDVFFTARRWRGEPRNAEPEKCSEVLWCARSALPSDMVGYARRALEHIGLGNAYGLYGWDAGDRSP